MKPLQRYIFPIVIVTTLLLSRNVSASCSAPANPIEAENCLTGNSPAEWDTGVNNDDPSIQGFATDISVNRGQAVFFKVNTTATNYTITIYRMGYYGGMGARKITTIQPSVTLPQHQPACLTDATKVIDCGNWAVSASWAVPSTATSGIYFAHLIRTDTGGDSHIFFIVRDDTSHSDLLFQTSDQTWQAYNDYGGHSLYGGAGNSDLSQRAFKVSYNRPFHTRDFEAASWVFSNEYPMVRWLEANGYDVSYFTGVDAARNGSLIVNHKTYMSVGHDEYWSGPQRTNVEAARAGGVNLAFFSGNEVFWKTRWENSIDGSNTPYRSMVCYKETLANAVIDPNDPPTWTGTWRDRRFSPPADGGRPENALTGTLFTVNGPGSDNDALSIRVPSADGKMRFWRGTTFANLLAGQTGVLPGGTLGYEWDTPVDNGLTPPGEFYMSTATYNLTTDYILDNGSTYGAGTATHHLTLYRYSSGALVFAAGTVQWSWGLDNNHDAEFSVAPAPSVEIQQATVNLLADMGSQPATLQPGLVPASASSDKIPPTSTITSPAPGATVQGGFPITIAGTAADSGGGVVGAVEVSTDGGATWRRATGRESWTTTWTPPNSGAATILSRAVDDSANLETPGAGVSLTVVGRTCPCSIWSSSITPTQTDSGDTSAVSLGVKFRSENSGYITGVRYYKSSGNGGTHVGSIWTTSGTLLASATFTGESTSGWQQVNFTTPVAIAANTTYIASYFAPQGHYSADGGFFALSGVDDPPLHALADGLDGPNGVYNYGPTNTFPTLTFNSTNYWVDVVFNSTATGGTGPSVVSESPLSGATGVSVNASVTATFNTSMDPTTITTSTFLLLAPSTSEGSTVVPASVTFNNSNLTATLIPTQALAASTTYTVQVVGGANGVKDVVGNSLATSFIWSFTTGAPPPPPGTCPCMIWPSTIIPTQVDGGDASAGEYGVKFRSDNAGFVIGLRFYKAPTNTGTHIGHLWTGTGTLLATAVFTGETTSGWQQVNFATPVAVTAGTTYVASYYAPIGHYSADVGYFTVGTDSPPLHALANGVDGPNGVYTYGSSAFPSSTFNSTNYWVDLVFSSATATSGPSVISVSPPQSALGIFTGTNVTATFNEAIDATTLTSSTFLLQDSSGNSVPATLAYTGSTNTAMLSPSVPLAPLTIYTVILAGGSTDPRVKDLSGNALATSFTWSFSTGTAGCPCSIFGLSTAPRGVDSDDSTAVELGVKFRSDISGFVTGIRFYKSPGNTGTHIGNLWSSSGGQLATATFVGESNSGWQQVNFATPVAITANTTYIASYYAPNGHYSADVGYFANSSADNSPLRGLVNGLDGPNGVYNTGSASAFPSSTFNSTNYWVDVVFSTTAAPTVGPSVTSISPTKGASNVSIGPKVVATFNEFLDPATINSSTFVLSDASGTPVPSAVAYDSTTSTATLDASVELAPSTTYTVTVVGGATDPRVKDMAGNALSTGFSWSFTTGAPPASTGPGGPILVISNASNPFSSYYSEILSAEGLNEFTVSDIATVSASTLGAYDVVILGDMPLSASQVSMFTNWVSAGGRLIAMHPDKQLAGLLGLVPSTSTLSNAYILVQTSASPGIGIFGQTMQFHGSADLYSLNGASALATLYSNATSATTSPAVTFTNVGSGQAAAFTYDLARSIVYTRQGNPAWSGQARDGQGGPVRSDDLYFGAATFDPETDWVDLTKVAIPQADEQQRLLANLVLQMESSRKPLPRFWYFPSGFKAVVVMTGDDHGVQSATAHRFSDFLAASPAGCSVADWQCVRSTSYLFPQVLAPNPMTDSQVAAFAAQGFEVSVHVDSVPGCSNWTISALDSFYANEMASLKSQFPSLAAPKTHRMHCIGWSDYDSQPIVERSHGIRFDTSYYYWPPTWVNNKPGLFTGSGMPMRFAGRDGNLIDVYQAVTQMTDESDQSYPLNIDTLLDNAVGSSGFYGAFVANMHNDQTGGGPPSWTYPGPGANQIVASAQARGVPVVSSLQMLTWLDGRNSSSFSSLGWNGNKLSFTITAGSGSRNLQAMVPTSSTAGALSGITLNGSPVAFTTQLIKGVSYGMFNATTGSYQAIYGGAPTVVLNTVTLNPASVVGGTGSTGTVTLSGPAPSGGAVVTLSTSNATVAQVPASVTVSAGGSSATFSVTTTSVASSTQVTIQGTYGSTQATTLTVVPSAATLASVTMNPTSVIGGASSTGTVTLSAQAPTGGAVVTLSSGNPAATLPASVTVSAGSTSAIFTVTTSGVASQTTSVITATYGASANATLTINPAVVSIVTLNPTSVAGGSNSTGTVTLNGLAPAGGAVVTLSSSNTGAAQVPATVTISAGSTSTTFTVTTSVVATTATSNISATYGATVSATLTVTQVLLSTLSLSPATVVGGNNSIGTVTLSGAAATGGAVVTLSSSNTAAATVPASVTVPAGSTSTTFTVTTLGVAASTSSIITATYGVAKTATLTVNAAALSSVTRTPASVVGGNNSTGTVTLNGAAPPAGAVVTLSSSNTAAAQVPASVTIAGGARSATFTITTSVVASQTTSTITASYAGVNRTTTLTVNPAALSSVTRTPSSVVGGNNSTGTVTLNGAAPAGGAVITLTSSNTAAAQVPANVTIAGGALSVTFTITTSGVASQTTSTITASYAGVNRTTTLTITVAALSSLVLSPSTVTGGTSSTATLTLNGAAPPSGALVATASSNTAAAQVPAQVTIPPGSTSTTFTVTTSPVTASTTSRISGTYRATTRNATLTVQ